MESTVPKTFGDLPARYADPATARAAILPAPYDGTSTWIKGADRGPDADHRGLGAPRALRHRDRLRGVPARHRHGTRARRVRRPRGDGGAGARGGRPPARRRPPPRHARRRALGDHRRGAGHGIPFPRPLGAAARRAHRPQARVRGLAPTTTPASWRGCASSAPSCRWGSAAWTRRKSRSSPKDASSFAERIQSGDGWMDRRARALSDTVYITVDLDVFDPSVMPSTGTPGAGRPGLVHGARACCARSARAARSSAFDVVELCPSRDDRAPDFLAAKLVYKMLSYILESPGAATIDPGREALVDKRELLSKPVEHVDITSFDSTPIIEAMRRMSFASRETAQAADLLERMLEDGACSVILTLAGLYQRRAAACRCTPTWCATTWWTRSSPPARPSWTWTSSRRSASGTTRAARTSTTGAARALRRPDLRHLHRRGAAAALRPHGQGDRRLPRPRRLLLARVHPRDGALAQVEREEEGQPRRGRVRRRRPDLLPGLFRLQRRASAWCCTRASARAAAYRSTRSRISAS